MAERPKGFGMSAEIADAIDGKYDENRAKEAMAWIMHFVPDAGLDGVSSSQDVHDKLKDGAILCRLANAVIPDSNIKINSSKMAFKQMENTSNFTSACEGYGVSRGDLFQTVNLYEATNMPQVIDGIFALGRKAAKNGLFGIGPKESDKNERQFTDEQMRAGDGHIGLQAGWNKGASQAGQNFGKTRAIID